MTARSTWALPSQSWRTGAAPSAITGRRREGPGFSARVQPVPSHPDLPHPVLGAPSLPKSLPRQGASYQRFIGEKTQIGGEAPYPGPHSQRAERIKTQTPKEAPTLRVCGNNGSKGTNLSNVQKVGPGQFALSRWLLEATHPTAIVFLPGSVSGLSFLNYQKYAPSDQITPCD